VCGGGLLSVGLPVYTAVPTIARPLMNGFDWLVAGLVVLLVLYLLFVLLAPELF
jgi:uncharacterized membrane protein YjfL (UPF0719 family)